MVEGDAFLEGVLFGVFVGELEGVGGGVDGFDFGVGQVVGEGEGDATAAGADVDEAGIGVVGEGALEDGVDELFGFGAGDEGAGVCVELEAVEVGGADDVLEGFVVEEAL